MNKKSNSEKKKNRPNHKPLIQSKTLTKMAPNKNKGIYTASTEVISIVSDLACNIPKKFRKSKGRPKKIKIHNHTIEKNRSTCKKNKKKKTM